MHKTAGEALFEHFCTNHGVRWEPIPTEALSGKKTPDYEIYPNGTKVITEVKDVHESPSERQQREQLDRVGWSVSGGTAKVGDRVRDIIETASKQLRKMAKGRYPALIVIYNPLFLLLHHTEPHAIKAAMYGFDTVILGLAPVQMRQKPRLLDRKSGPGRKMGSQFNTTVSAVALLDGEGLTIYHNIFAALPLTVEVFTGIAVQFTLGEKRPGDFDKWREVG